jgi:hypothetical protein
VTAGKQTYGARNGCKAMADACQSASAHHSSPAAADGVVGCASIGTDGDDAALGTGFDAIEQRLGEQEGREIANYKPW